MRERIITLNAMYGRRLARLQGAIVASALIAACGGSGRSPSTSSRTQLSTSTAVSATGSSSSTGKSVFRESCGGCHTLAVAGTHGTVGPDLDRLKPSDALVVNAVINGRTGMPSFADTLSNVQIERVAGYVSVVAGASVPTTTSSTTTKTSDSYRRDRDHDRDCLPGYGDGDQDWDCGPGYSPEHRGEPPHVPGQMVGPGPMRGDMGGR